MAVSTRLLVDRCGNHSRPLNFFASGVCSSGYVLSCLISVRDRWRIFACGISVSVWLASRIFLGVTFGGVVFFFSFLLGGLFLLYRFP